MFKCYYIKFQATMTMVRLRYKDYGGEVSCGPFPPNWLVSIAAPIILFPLMIDVVHIMICFLAVAELAIGRMWGTTGHTFFLLRHKT